MITKQFLLRCVLNFAVGLGAGLVLAVAIEWYTSPPKPYLVDKGDLPLLRRRHIRGL